jgi:hypothetical protein
MGAGLSHIPALSITGMVWPILLPVLAGAGFIALTTLYKQVQLARKRQLEWALEELARARAQATTHVDNVINELKPEVAASFRGLLTGRIRELQAVVNEADAALRKDEKDRANRITVLEAQLGAVHARLTDVDRMLTARPTDADGTNLSLAGSKPATP